MHAQSWHAEAFQGFHRHYDAQIGTADADIDDVGNFPSRVTLQRTAVQGVGQGPHLFTFCLHKGHDVLAIQRQRAIGRTPERNVQRGTLLGVVDPLSAKHALDPLRQAHLFGQRQQQRQPLGIEPLPAEVQPQPFSLRGQPAAALGLLLEERRDRHALESGGTLPKLGPGRGTGSVRIFVHR